MDTFEKKYNEAMLRADEAVQKGCLDKDMFDIIFPPEESEDERIRKALIDGVRQIRCKNGITQEQMIAYLEKQKEQKPAEWSEEDEKKLPYDDVCAIEQMLKSELDERVADLPSSCIHALARRISSHFSFEYRPVEWSENDLKMLNECVEIMEKFRDSGSGWPMYLNEINWLKSLRPQPHWKPAENQMAWLKLAIDEAKEPLKSQLEELYKNIRENLIWK